MKAVRRRPPRRVWPPGKTHYQNPEASEPNLGAATPYFAEVPTDAGGYFAGTLSLSWGVLWECACRHTAPALAIRCARMFQEDRGWALPAKQVKPAWQLELISRDTVADPPPF